MSFEQLARDLQDELAMVDLLNSASSWDGNIALMVKKLDPMKLRMSPDKNHFRAHLHIDYGKELRHAASYAVDTGERLVGSVEKSERDKAIKGWIETNRDELLCLWEDLRKGGDGTEFVARLKAS
jgi:hypothetical protein